MNSRLKKIRLLLAKFSIEVMVIIPGPTLKYLTGLSSHLMERPILMILKKDDYPLFLLPELETPKLESLSFPYNVITYNDEPQSLDDAIRKARQLVPIKENTIGVEPTIMRYLEMKILKEIFPNVEFVSSETILTELRIEKSEEEVANILKAIEIAEIALKNTIPTIKPGCTEREIASELIIQLLREGSHIDLPFPPIVASGPNSASPHAIPGNRQLVYGDLLIIDWGANFSGYASDLTRTFAIGNINPELERIYSIVLKANETALEAAKPGQSAHNVDYSARKVIEDASYGKFFIHRTGHGLGLEAHEAPYISQNNHHILTPGNVFTIEPGIYIPGLGGVRIEDDVLITEKGNKILTSYSRELTKIY